ncbi:hypothetical protein [Acidiphilium sp. C61]|jgi:hypothetical protein|uniref:hypothetical protein n=1 Tax=Acidiphilium sp. C61 TaxID=1671485 RepID=UPI00157B8112|nr:hypothetical protein [Acidiphilium sp. C61]
MNQTLRSPHTFRSALALALLGLSLAGCALVTPPPSTGYLPANAFDGRVTGEDPAIAATNEARWAFSHPAAMQGRPAEMALAAASLDAMAGQFSTVGRWLGMNNLTKLQMLHARKVVRAELGIRPDTPSQTVIDALVTISLDLRHGDRKAALAAANGSEFTLPPRRTLAILAHFPATPVAERATAAASRDLYPGGSPPFFTR